ncbi:MAG: exodeoxyribonuclease VII small subunit [Methanotrichaceae archaeon]|nr:exodeoxyribonuclease VII small subunit [Methanotrichaceae archaeon]
MLDDDFRLEEALEDLEKIVEELENGKIPLDESLALFERGIKLIRLCNIKLDNAEQRIESLTGELPEDLSKLS